MVGLTLAYPWSLQIPEGNTRVRRSGWAPPEGNALPQKGYSRAPIWASRAWTRGWSESCWV